MIDERKLFLRALMAEFSAFVIESYDEGCSQGNDDHFQFIDECLAVFMELKTEESEGK